jgi:hypothetical protein
VPRRSKPRSLAAALAYESDEVIFRFQKQFRLSYRETAELFRETRRWLWVLARSLYVADAPKLGIYPQMLIVDEMWHNFALFTKEYARFCATYLGGYVHHLPATRADLLAQRASFARAPKAFTRRAERRLVDQCAFIVAELGEDTLARWYAQYPARYTKAFVNARRRPLG